MAKKIITVAVGTGVVFGTVVLPVANAAASTPSPRALDSCRRVAVLRTKTTIGNVGASSVILKKGVYRIRVHKIGCNAAASNLNAFVENGVTGRGWTATQLNTNMNAARFRKGNMVFRIVRAPGE